MKAELLNKLSPEGREQIIQLEGQLREINQLKEDEGERVPIRMRLFR